MKLGLSDKRVRSSDQQNLKVPDDSDSDRGWIVLRTIRLVLSGATIRPMY